VVLFIELVSEVVLLGCLLGFLVAGKVWLVYGIVGSTLAVPVVLFLHGYYFTRVLGGFLLRFQKRWFYPAIAATLFVSHLYYALSQAQSDLTSFAQAIEVPFLSFGAGIVFVCAYVGDGWLRKWSTQSAVVPNQRIAT
jgi:hypothetical protein